MTSPIPLFGIPSKAPVVSFWTLDDASVRDSVSFAMPRQLSPPMQDAAKPTKGLFARKATPVEKGKFLDLMVGSPPLYVDFMASMNGENVSLMDKLANVAATSAGGSTPLTTVGAQVKIEVPPSYAGKRQPSVHIWLTQMERYIRLIK